MARRRALLELVPCDVLGLVLVLVLVYRQSVDSECGGEGDMQAGGSEPQVS